MNSYLDLAATGQVLLYSLVAVVAVVGTFSFGALSLARAEGARDAARPGGLYFTAAYLCFAVAAVAVVIGVWFILDK